MHTQLLMTSKGLIDPTLPVGSAAFSNANSNTYPGNAYPYEAFRNSFTIPDNWKTKNYTYTMSWNSTADYVYFAPRTELYVNGVLDSAWDLISSTYYRYNSGVLSYNKVLNLKAKDTVLAIMYGRGRNVGGATPISTCTHDLKRTT